MKLKRNVLLGLGLILTTIAIHSQSLPLPQLLDTRFDITMMSCNPETCEPRDCSDHTDCNSTIQSNQESTLAIELEDYITSISEQKEVPCGDPDDPDRTEIRNFIDATQVTLPLDIYRVRLCGGQEAYMPHTVYAQLPLPKVLEETITINSYHQTFDIVIDGQEHRVDLTTFLEFFLVVDRSTSVQLSGAAPCGEEVCTSVLIEGTNAEIASQQQIVGYLQNQNASLDPATLSYPVDISLVALIGGQTLWVLDYELDVLDDTPIQVLETQSISSDAGLVEIQDLTSCRDFEDEITIETVDPSCEDPASGEILISLSGTAASVFTQFSIDGGETYQESPLFEGLSQANYTVTLANSSGSQRLFLDEVYILTNPCAESNKESCGDGIDNDGDGLLDCDDSDCQHLYSCSEEVCQLIDLIQCDISSIQVLNLSFVNDDHKESEFNKQLENLGLSQEDLFNELQQIDGIIYELEQSQESDLSIFSELDPDVFILTPYEFQEDLSAWSFSIPIRSAHVGDRNIITTVITDKDTQLKSSSDNICPDVITTDLCGNSFDVTTSHINDPFSSYVTVSFSNRDESQPIDLHIYAKKELSDEPAFIRSITDQYSDVLQFSLARSSEILVVAEEGSTCYAYSVSSECLIEENITYDINPGDDLCFSKTQFASLFDCPVDNIAYCLELGNGLDEICLTNGEEQIEIIITDGTNIIANPTIHINIPEDCSDGLDNDSDGLIDCFDTECSNLAECAYLMDIPEGSISGDPNTCVKCHKCFDGLDNDLDGSIDFYDLGCYCCLPDSDSDGLPDHNGLSGDDFRQLDFEGPNYLWCDPRSDDCPAELNSCSDGLDNDGDGLIDCQEPACRAAPDINCENLTIETSCGDLVDNDGDGLIDCLDPDCESFMSCDYGSGGETTVDQCSDGIDNDEDGLIDCLDIGCYSRLGGLFVCTPASDVELRIRFDSYNCETNRAIYSIETFNHGPDLALINDFVLELFVERAYVNSIRTRSYGSNNLGSGIGSVGTDHPIRNDMTDPILLAISNNNLNRVGYAFLQRPLSGWKTLVDLDIKLSNVEELGDGCLNLIWNDNDPNDQEPNGLLQHIRSEPGFPGSWKNIPRYNISNFTDWRSSDDPDRYCLANKCGTENTMASCTDMIDNDQDGLVDCFDDDCHTQETCIPDCDNSDDLIRFFESSGFRSFDVVIGSPPPLGVLGKSVQKSSDEIIEGEQPSVMKETTTPEFSMRHDIFSTIVSQNNVDKALVSYCEDDILVIQDFMKKFRDNDHVLWAHLISQDGGNTGVLWVGGKTQYNTDIVAEPGYQGQLTKMMNAAGPHYTFGAGVLYSQIFMLARLMSGNYMDQNFDEVFPDEIPEIMGHETALCTDQIGGFSITPTGHPIAFDESHGRVALRFEPMGGFEFFYDRQALSGFTNRFGIYAGHIQEIGNQRDFLGYQNLFSEELDFIPLNVNAVVGSTYDVLIGSIIPPGMERPSHYYKASYHLTSVVDDFTLVPDFTNVSTISDRQIVSKENPTNFITDLGDLIEQLRLGLQHFEHEGDLYFAIDRDNFRWVRYDKDDQTFYTWDCFRGVWDRLIGATDQLRFLIDHIVGIADISSDNPGECNLEVSAEALFDEGVTPNSFTRTPSFAFDQGANLVEYASGYGADLESNINRLSRLWGTSIKYIVSAEGVDYNLDELSDSPEPFSSKDLADEFFVAYDFDSGEDLAMHIHFKLDGSASVCIKYNESFFGTLNNDIYVDEDGEEFFQPENVRNTEKNEVKSVIRNTFNEIASYKEEQESGEGTRNTPISNPYADGTESFIEFNPQETKGVNPWYYTGTRENRPFFSFFSEIKGIGKSIVTKYKIPPTVWYPSNNSQGVRGDSLSYLDGPGGIFGVLNGTIEENPIAQLAQLCELVYKVYDDKEEREKLFNAAKEPLKTGRAIIDSEVQKFKDPNRTDEEKQHDAAKIGTQIAIMIATGGVSTIKKVTTTISQIKDQGLRQSLELASKNVAGGAQNILDNLNDILKKLDIDAATFDAFLLKMRNIKSPDIANIKESIMRRIAKIDCPLKSTSPCDLLKEFISDIAKTDLLEAFKKFPDKFDELNDAWDALFPDALLRTNTDWLVEVSNYFKLKPNRIDEFIDHFVVEKGKGRERAYLKSLTKRQTYNGTVWRNQNIMDGAPPGREYEKFFNNGMQPKGQHDNLLRHTEKTTTPGNFISSTSDIKVVPDFGNNSGWVYEIKSTNGIDINKTLGEDALFFGQKEISIPDGVLAKDIKGVWRKTNRILVEWIPNPNFKP